MFRSRGKVCDERDALRRARAVDVRKRGVRLFRVSEPDEPVSDPTSGSFLPPALSDHQTDDRLVDPGGAGYGGVDESFQRSRVRVFAVQAADPELGVARHAAVRVLRRRVAASPLFPPAPLRARLFREFSRLFRKVRRVERRALELPRVDEFGGGGDAAVGRAPRAARLVRVVVVSEQLVARRERVTAHETREVGFGRRRRLLLR
mmetsp:Transcript_7822/g.34498  ORF Transcript_7822/g.34498 Transcript_7822/m.34498 type:complete len:205 (-) Transcript_7822:18-632(-)